MAVLAVLAVMAVMTAMTAFVVATRRSLHALRLTKRLASLTCAYLFFWVICIAVLLALVAVFDCLPCWRKLLMEPKPLLRGHGALKCCTECGAIFGR
eukprot:jgi/Mesvir1/20251/Mv25416-RA.1